MKTNRSKLLKSFAASILVLGMIGCSSRPNVFTESLDERLRRLNEEHGLSVVLVSHDLNLASQYADRLLLLMNGELFRLGTPDEVIRPDVLQAVYGCPVLVDRHPDTQRPRVTLPGR